MTLPDPQAFKRLREEYAHEDKKREYTIKQSRVVAKKSKHAIYLVHEQKYSQAKQQLQAAAQTRQEIHAQGDAKQPSYTQALEEYVEAAALLAFMQEESLPTEQDLEVDAQTYLAGLADLTGELLRAATRAAIQEDDQFITRVRDFIDALHGELLQIPLRNNHVRKKADSVKYHLQKIEHLQYETALRRKN